MPSIWLPCLHAMNDDNACSEIDVDTALIMPHQPNPYLPVIDRLIYACRYESPMGNSCHCPHSVTSLVETVLAKSYGMLELGPGQMPTFAHCNGCEYDLALPMANLTCNVYGRSALQSYATWTCHHCRCLNNEPIRDYQTFNILQRNGAGVVMLSADNDKPTFGDYPNAGKAMYALDQTDDVWALLEDAWREVIVNDDE